MASTDFYKGNLAPAGLRNSSRTQLASVHLKRYNQKKTKKNCENGNLSSNNLDFEQVEDAFFSER